jgi:hypothetical protein
MYYKDLGMKRVENPPEGELVEILVFNKDDIEQNRIDFRWIHSREFKYNGEMYDIIKKDENNERLILHCINDKKEKRLEEEFAKKINDNSKNNKQQQVSYHLNIILSEPVQTETINFAFNGTTNFFREISNSYNSVQLDIPSPPPRPV